MSLIHKFRLILSLMDASDKRRLVTILLLLIFNGLFSMVGVASVLPFIGLISQPELLESNRYILQFKQITGIESYAAVVLSFGGISLLLLVVGNLVSLFSLYYSKIFGHNKDSVLSERLLRNFLHLDVLEFEKKKSSERAKEIIADVERVILRTLFAMFEFLAGSFIVICIVGLLLFIDWKVMLVVACSLVGIRLLINRFTSTRLNDLGKEFAHLEAANYGDVLDALKLHKEIKLNGISGYFLDRFSCTFNSIVRNRLRYALTQLVPKYALETLTYAIVLLMAIYFAVFSGSGAETVTLVGIFAFSAYRLMPAVGNVFRSMEDIWYGSAILEDFVRFYEIQEEVEEPPPLNPVRDSIGLSNVSFRFSPNGAFHIESLNLDFPVGRMTCIKGRTGCGKSTILNLMAGLYQPSVGTVVADGDPVDAYASNAWKKQIGFVPPNVNIIQASLYENIALGLSLDGIDRQRARSVSALVDLDSHINALKDGYDSVYGEEGLSFSSGQIQKVGLARALYRNPSILLLDESTDAFDLETEKLVLDQLKEIEGLTIIFVSHRPSVCECADKVVDLEDLLTLPPVR